jgi:hypothetical protein
MKSVNNLKRAVKLQDEIHENVTKDILVGVGVDSAARKSTYIYMKHANGREAFSLTDMTDKEVLKKAKELCKATFTKVTTLCLDIIGEEVWIDKETPITINSIARDSEGNNIVTTTTGKTYSADNLYIKG